MIKIEISDVEKLDPEVLRATGRYLLDLSGGDVHTHPSEEKRLHNKAEQIADMYEGEDLNVKDPNWNIDRELEKTVKTHVEAGKQFLKETVEQCFPMSTQKIEIEEELIPVPAEVVNIPPPPAPEQVFAQQTGRVNRSATGVELDTEGMPWDFRIHARTKTKMKDGSWKKLRGVGPEIVKKVEAELRTVQSIPTPPPAVAIPVPPAAVVPPVPVPPATPGFSELMALITKSITEGKLKRDQVTEILKPMGIESLPLISTRLDLIPSVMVAIEGVINGAC